MIIFALIQVQKTVLKLALQYGVMQFIHMPSAYGEMKGESSGVANSFELLRPMQRGKVEAINIRTLQSEFNFDVNI